jgi:formamidopyrimidine-DNA glycosylase
MIELPEAAVLAQQLSTAIRAKTIRSVVAAQSPHKFAWYSGDPAGYSGFLTGKTVGQAASLVEKQNYLGGSIYFCPGCQKE